MTYIKYTAYSAMILFFVGLSVLTGLRYFGNGKGAVHYHYYEPVAYMGTPVTFCINDPRENIQYVTKEEVIYVRPLIRPTVNPGPSYVMDSRLELPTVKETKIQKGSMEFYLEGRDKK